MVVAGPGADARALGLYFAGGDQHFEHRVVARHEAPQAYSNLLYKGAIQDHAHTVFFGNLVVPPGAPGTDAYQTNRNLVLNDGARADTIPFLEIETAEVKCSHAGAGRPRGRRAPLLPPVAGRPHGRGQAPHRDGLPPGGARAGQPRRAARRARGGRPGEAQVIDVAGIADLPPASPSWCRPATPPCAWSTSTGPCTPCTTSAPTRWSRSRPDGWRATRIECPRHGAAFSLITGEVLSPPATTDLPTFAVEVRDGRVLLDPTPTRDHPLFRSPAKTEE